MEDCLYFGLCCCVIDALCGSCCVGGEGKEVAYAAPAAKASKPKKAKKNKKAKGNAGEEPEVDFTMADADAADNVVW